MTESSVALPPEQERGQRHHRLFTLASGDPIVRPPDVIDCASIKEANTAAEALSITASLRGYFDDLLSPPSGVKGGTKIRESTERVSGGRGGVLCSGVKTKVACPVTGTGLIKQAVVVRRPWQPPEIRRPPASGSLQAANLSSFLSALFETASNK